MIKVTLDIFKNTQESYSFDAYGEDAWIKNIEELLREGYDQIQVEWIMKSKISRWALDMEKTITEYIKNHIGEKTLAKFMAED